MFYVFFKCLFERCVGLRKTQLFELYSLSGWFWQVGHLIAMAALCLGGLLCHGWLCGSEPNDSWIFLGYLLLDAQVSILFARIEPKPSANPIWVKVVKTRGFALGIFGLRRNWPFLVPCGRAVGPN